MPSSNGNVTVIIVDDEKEACANLEHILANYIEHGVYVAGTANSTKEAEKLIAATAPDAVFLDIEMPQENAFRFLERIAPVNFEVIFVTAYDEYAVKAFKLNAIDYILKPISIKELGQAIVKIKEKAGLKRMLSGPAGNVPYPEIGQMITGKTKSHRITLKDNNVVEVVDFRDIYFIEAQGSYTRVVFLKEKVMKEITMSGSLTEYEELLPSDLFFRIHKSYLINCAHVKKIIRGDYAEVILAGNYTLPISRRRYTSLIEFLKSNDYYNE